MKFSDYIQSHLESSKQTKTRLAEHAPLIEKFGQKVAACLLRGGKILVCGNGGSASDSEHIAAEFVGRFRRERRSVPSISLTGPSALVTAIGNDYGYENVFSRQVEGQGQSGDVLICISTSGNSPSVIAAAITAVKMGIFTVGLTGEKGGQLAGAVDLAIAVPSLVTAHIQESHITIAHIVCEITDELLEEASSLVSAGLRSPLFNPGVTKKGISLESLVMLREFWKRCGQTIIWTNGCFDLLHIGHVRNLQDARALGDVLIVGINSDQSVKTIKGPKRPVQSEAERSEMLAALVCVDYVTIFQEATPVRALELLRPDVHCKGADYTDGAKPIPERELVESYGGKIHFLQLHHGFSTTSLIERICSEN